MKSKIIRFEDLQVWRSSMNLAIAIYKISDSGKLSRDFALKNQIRRAALSISSNIAEGYEYNNNKQFIRYLRYAKGSAGELRSQLFLLLQLDLVSEEVYRKKQNDLISVSNQLMGFIKYLQKNLASSP